jgi:hypothetical protein
MDQNQTLNEVLGYGPQDKLLILNCGELGMSFSTTEATYKIIHQDLNISASIMLPCPYSRVAIDGYRGKNVGIRLVLTSPFNYYRWEPVTHSPSLLDGNGGFPKTIFDLWEHADSDEVYKECTAQIEKAIIYGFDLTHISDHCGVFNFRPELFSIYLDLACDYKLPISLANTEYTEKVGFPFRQVAKNSGLIFPDFTVRAEYDDNNLLALKDILANLRSGVTECIMRPSEDTNEISSIADDKFTRKSDYKSLIDTKELKSLLDKYEITLISFDDLRKIARSTA